MDRMTKAHATMANWLPPVTKLASGEYAVVGIELKTARLTDFGSVDIQGKPAVTELQ